MNRIKYLVFLFIGLFMFSNVYAKENVEIKSIELDSKSTNANVKNDATYNGLKMNYDVSFKELNDFVKYKIVLKNNTGSNYTISNSVSSDEHVSYEYSGDSVLNANGEATIYLTTTYKTKVKDSEFERHAYQNTSRVDIPIKNVSNPKTGEVKHLLIIISILIISIILLIVMFKNKNIRKYTTVCLIISIFMLPIVVFAEELFLTINANITIEKGYKVGYLIHDKVLYTDEELEMYEKTPETECFSVYIGSKDDENKYNYCEYIIISDETLYSEGEKVVLQGIKVKRLYNIWYECNEERDGSYVCPRNTQIKNIYKWGYSLVEYHDYYALEDDYDVMDFREYYSDRWYEYGDFKVYAPQKFNMPGHDVLFYEIID